MKVGLVDVDGHNFPNLVLMKLSAWHKHQGDSVHLLRPDDVLLGGDLFGGYDKLYAACVFTANAETARRLAEIGAEVGGTGTDLTSTTVRRLTPTECERLQGLHDGHTEGGSDTARYKALGNGMAQPCADYVIRRIVEVSDDAH